MSLAATFLGGAKSRLLPASVPFRYFAAAAVFHCLAWALLLAGAQDLIGFQGGLGLPIAAIHMLTIGVLAMTAMGAAFQLLPVATVQPLGRIWPARAAFWLIAPGVPLLTLGLARGTTSALVAGAIMAGAALAIFAAAISENLWRARAMPLVAAHGWAALSALVAVLVFGLLLSLDYSKGLLPDHQQAAVAHFLLAAFGFMGLLALGFGYVLVPMFALSPNPPAKLGWSSLGLAATGLLLGTLGALTGRNTLLALAALAGLGSAAAHLAAMRWVWVKRMRKRMGLSFVLVRASWVLLVLGLLAGLSLALGAPIPGSGTLFGFLVLAGWLLTFLTGILQRILPFLASMHAAGKSKKPPLVSELTPERPLEAHAALHAAAIPLVVAGLMLSSPLLVRLGAFSGFLASLAFGYFTLEVIRRLAARMSD